MSSLLRTDFLRYKDKDEVEVLNPEGFFNCIILNYG